MKEILKSKYDLEIPECPKPVALYRPCARVGNLLYLSGQTGRQTDQALAVVFEQLPVDAGMAVEAFGKGKRIQIDQIFIAGLVFAEQNEVVVFAAVTGIAGIEAAV